MKGGGTSIAYPSHAGERDRWIRARRPPRHPVDRHRANAVFIEDEADAAGVARRALTILLAGRECPFTCVMCDLWRDTMPRSAYTGAIAEQVTLALEGIRGIEVVKLYNSGSFFDPRAVPPRELPVIAALLAPIGRVIVESHPAFVGDAIARFRDALT